MKAVVYHGAGKRAWEEVPDPTILEPTDVIARVDTTTICGTDLHILKATFPRLKKDVFWATRLSARLPKSVLRSPI